MICLNWNVWWANDRLARGETVQSLVEKSKADVVCLTETTLSIVPVTGHQIDAGLDWGYQHDGTRRKVVLWSREPWVDVDSVGAESMPGGRFVSGVTQGIRFVGVCIPWKDAHVTSGRRDRTPWEDHLAYLSGLAAVLERYQDADESLCVLGDYNQRIPRKYQPIRVAEALSNVLGENLVVATAGKTDDEGMLLIDHYSHTTDLAVEVLEIIPRKSAEGTKLSDHVGVIASISPIKQTS